jgi:hypothetical protein
VVDTVCQHVTLTDLLVLRATAFSPELANCCLQPILLVPDKATPLTKVLLVYDAEQQDTLFVAAYLAEAWRLGLTIALSTRFVPDLVQKYMEMHEIEANYVLEFSPTEQMLKQTIAAQQTDLIILGAEILSRVNLASWSVPVLLCR